MALSLMCVFLLITGVICAVTHLQNDDLNQMNIDSFGVNIVKPGGNLASSVREEVEINERLNYVRVTTPADGTVDEMILIHDYNQDLTLVKSNGRCFLINNYKDIPATLGDWYDLEKYAFDDVIEPDSAEEKHYSYKNSHVAVNRTTLPPAMQRECDQVELAVLEGTIGEPATDKVFSGEMYLPPLSEGSAGKIRTKRGWWRKKEKEVVVVVVVVVVVKE